MDFVPRPNGKKGELWIRFRFYCRAFRTAGVFPLVSPDLAARQFSYVRGQLILRSGQLITKLWSLQCTRI